MSGRGTTGLQTTLPGPLAGTGRPAEPVIHSTPEQRARWEAIQAQRERDQANLRAAFRTPAQQLEDERDRASREEAAHRTRWPDGPRAALRDAHAQLRDAKGELAHRQDALERAKGLVEDKKSFLDRLRAAAGATDRQAIDALKQAITSNAPAAAADGAGEGQAFLGTPHRPTPVHVPERGALTAQDAIQEAAHAVEIASAATLELAASLAPAEQAVTRAQRAVTEAAVAVVIDRGLRLADLVAVAEREADRLRSALLGIDRPWIDGKPIKLPAKIVTALAGHISGGRRLGDGAEGVTG
jgi:hypothetical protein